jgi:hypothetical protein
MVGEGARRGDTGGRKRGGLDKPDMVTTLDRKALCAHVEGATDDEEREGGICE